MNFKVKDSNLFLIPENPHMLHLATITYGLREFWVMSCIKGTFEGSVYIEEMVPHMNSKVEDIEFNFKFIKDDKLAFDLAKFAELKGLTDVKKRLEEILDSGKLDLLGDSLAQSRRQGPDKVHGS